MKSSYPLIPYPTTLLFQVATLRLSGTLKLDCGYVNESLSPFDEIRLTFLKKPYIDFSLLFSETDGVDVLNVGELVVLSVFIVLLSVKVVFIMSYR